MIGPGYAAGMSTAEVLPDASFEAFLAAEQDSERRHEWVAGRVYAMAGGTERHDLMVGLLDEKLVVGARPPGCRSHGRVIFELDLDVDALYDTLDDTALT